MSISLTIERPNRDIESLPLGSHMSHKEVWAPIAARLGLVLIPQFYSFLPVLPEYLDQMLGELTVFRKELIHLGAGHEGYVEYVDRLSNALRDLKGSAEWSAAIG